MKYRIKCGLCAETFVHVGNEYPDECPVCNQYVGIDGKATIAAPFISLKSGKNPDKLYRQMEAGAEARIEMAAEMTGQDKSEFASMKMTNMKDSLREGDTSFVPSTPTPAGMEVQMGLKPEVAAGLSQGPHQRAGSGQLKGLQQFHQSNHRQMVASGQVRHRGH